jgi:hypothetical protein
MFSDSKLEDGWMMGRARSKVIIQASVRDEHASA